MSRHKKVQETLIADSNEPVRSIANIIVHCTENDMCHVDCDTLCCFGCQEWAVEHAQAILTLLQGDLNVNV